MSNEGASCFDAGRVGWWLHAFHVPVASRIVPVRGLDSHSISVRGAFSMLAFAVAGFVLAVVGSLAPMLWIHSLSSRKYDVVTPPTWFIPPPQGWPLVPEHTLKDSRFGWQTTSSKVEAVYLDVTYVSGRKPTPPTGYWMGEWRSGVPFHGLRRVSADIHVMDVAITAVPLPLLHDGIASPAWLLDGSHPRERIPIEPLPLGFAANWLFYTLLIAGCARAIRWQRRRRRTAKGLCASCAYRLDGMQTCPECGHAREGGRGGAGKAV